MKCYKKSIKYISNEVIDDIHSVYQAQLYVQQVQQLHPQRYHEGGAHYRTLSSSSSPETVSKSLMKMKIISIDSSDLMMMKKNSSEHNVDEDTIKKIIEFDQKC